MAIGTTLFCPNDPYIAQLIYARALRAISVRQDKPGAFSGCNSRPRKGEEPPHRESSLGLMKVTTWVKRRQSDGQAVTQVKRLSLVTYPGADRVENLEGYSRRPPEAMVAGDSGNASG